MTNNIFGTYSFGVGDRFALSTKAQLHAIQMATQQGLAVTPVWNKSYREHTIAHSEPIETREAVDAAVRELQWGGSYFVDADHVTIHTVESFVDCSDYFTLDIAEYIGKPASPEGREQFARLNKGYCRRLQPEGMNGALEITEEILSRFAEKYLFAVQQAAEIYRYIQNRKKPEAFVIEVSMDEADTPQTPAELLFLAIALLQESVPVRALAPKFSGRFNKGVDYVGDPDRFHKEFESHLCVLRFASKEFGLSEDIKISVHTGSDKFSIYPKINEAIKKYDAGVHVKTAGTTWLEELIGLAEAGEDGLNIAKKIYRQAYSKCDALCAPYTAVIDIDASELPSSDLVDSWNGKRFAETLRHDQENPCYNPNFRQLLHVGFKIAADLGEELFDAIRRHENAIAENVTKNIYSRHIKPIFLD